MRSFTHLSAGIFAAALFDLPFLFTILGSLLPDIDLPVSKFGRKPWWIPIPHRGPTHSFVFAMFAGAIVWWLIGPLYAVAISVGVISHIILDAMTPKGAPLLWPVPARTHGRVRFSLILELLISAVLLTSAILVWIY